MEQETPSYPESVDVIVVGGGPTGLLITYILLRSGLKVIAIEQYDKFEQALYGRACMLYAGSLELLDLIGIYDRIADVGFIVRNAVTFKDGEPFTNRGWTFIQKALASNTHFDFSFSIRQKHLEDAIRSAISELSSNAVRAPVKLIDYRVTQSPNYPIVAVIEQEGRTVEISCKYLIGADGGRSTVRSLGKFPFPGTLSPHKWVRLDAVVSTNMPSSRSKAVALESRGYGNVLWTPTDNGRTRIGFVCPDNVYSKHGNGITEEAITNAAKNALKPFTLEFVKLDWWTVYEIGQRVAERYKDGRVFLAGDAAHTHSSGAAQGMNTGLHDATNLAWKLAGVLSGVYDESILDTYDLERRASAEHLIQLDKDISALISGTIPSHFNAPPDANVNDYLELVYSSNASFTVGLGISYEKNLLNVEGHVPASSAKVGHRALDAPLYRPGAAFPKTLRSLTPYVGRFWIMIFAGRLERTPDAVRLNPNCSTKYRALREYLDSPNSFTQILAPAFEFLTILHGEGSLQSAETIGVQPLGKTAYDQSGEAYKKYGISEDGAVVVMRPDGIICFSSPLDGYRELSDYFIAFVRPSRAKWESNEVKVTSQAVGGEISIEGQEESTQLSMRVIDRSADPIPM